MDENSDEGDGAMLAETISFKVEVECARRRDRGKKSLEFWYSRDKTRGRRRGSHAKGRNIFQSWMKIVQSFEQGN